VTSVTRRLAHLEAVLERVAPSPVCRLPDLETLRRLPPEELLRLRRETLGRPGPSVRDTAEYERLRRLPREELLRRHRKAMGDVP
jgi:hypothetical protein